MSIVIPTTSYNYGCISHFWAELHRGVALWGIFHKLVFIGLKLNQQTTGVTTLYLVRNRKRPYPEHVTHLLTTMSHQHRVGPFLYLRPHVSYGKTTNWCGEHENNYIYIVEEIEVFVGYMFRQTPFCWALHFSNHLKPMPRSAICIDMPCLRSFCMSSTHSASACGINRSIPWRPRFTGQDVSNHGMVLLLKLLKTSFQQWTQNNYWWDLSNIYPQVVKYEMVFYREPLVATWVTWKNQIRGCFMPELGDLIWDPQTTDQFILIYS